LTHRRAVRAGKCKRVKVWRHGREPGSSDEGMRWLAQSHIVPRPIPTMRGGNGAFHILGQHQPLFDKPASG
jgi:hypothetical protein